MPGVEDYINCPLDIIQGLSVEGKDADLTAQVKEYFSKRLSTPTALSWVPSLNDVPLHNLRTNTLVKFRGMVQDMFDTEFYLGKYEIENEKTGEKKLISGKYKDIAECQSGWRIQMESASNKTYDRQTLYCIPVPGEQDWVKEVYKGMSKVNPAPSTSSSTSRSKRPLEDEAICESSTPGASTGSEVPMETGGGAGVTEDGASSAAADPDSKKAKTDAKPGTSSSSTPDLHFPLPGEKGPAVLVKIYEDAESHKLNHLYEFIGVLSNDPAMVQFHESEGKSSLMDMEGDLMEDVEEEKARSPPPSLVPRLHVILSKPIKHGNPQLPEDFSADQHKEEIDRVLRTARECRTNLLSILEQMVFGDKLAAEFILCYLISHVYARQDVIPLGKFCLNLSGCPQNSNFSSYFYRILEQLVTKSHLLQMSLSNMNNLKFTPRKDYNANKLCTGLLQLSERTHLVVDETALQPGQLDANGVRNITALGNLIRWQKVEYDFNFHRQEFPSNVSVLVVSEGKSLLPCDTQVKICPQQQSGEESLDERYKGIEMFLTPALLTQLRSYLTLCQLLDYSLPDDVQKIVEEDFVEMRKDDPKNMTVEDLHSLLVLARLLTLSYGVRSLSRELWEQAKRMEQTRKTRLVSSSVASTA